METKRKSNSVVTVREDGDALVFDVIGAGSVTFDLTKASNECNTRAMFHGWKQRISDAAAMSRNPETGAAASPADKLAAMRALVEHYESGTDQWARRGGGESAPSAALTVEAIARVKGISVEMARASVESYATKHHGGDVKKALAFFRGAKTVAEAMVEIRRERMGEAAINADAALDEIE